MLSRILCYSLCIILIFNLIQYHVTRSMLLDVIDLVMLKQFLKFKCINRLELDNMCILCNQSVVKRTIRKFETI